MWNCSDDKCASSVECPDGQVFRKDLRSCATTCDTLGSCMGDEPLVEGCGCPKNHVLSPKVGLRGGGMGEDVWAVWWSGGGV